MWIRAIFALVLGAGCAIAQINATAAHNIQQGRLTTITDTGAGNAYSGCPIIPLLVYGSGVTVKLIPSTGNSGASTPTINVCGLGVRNIKTASGVDPTAGQIIAGSPNVLEDNGSEFRLISSTGSTGSSGPAFSSTVPVTYSTTPAFVVPSSSTTGAAFKITLGGNVVSSTLASATSGQMLNWLICQDGTGGRSFVWPANVIGGMTISATRNSTASTCYTQTGVYDGTNALMDREYTAGGSGAITVLGNNLIDIDTSIVARVAANNTWAAPQTFATKYTVPFGSLTAAGTTDVTLVSLAATQVITKCLAKHSINFTGGALSAMTVSVGNTTIVDQFCPVLPVGSGAGVTSFVADGLLGKRTFAAENVVAHFTCTSANCNAATAGSLDIYLWIENLP